MAHATPSRLWTSMEEALLPDSQQDTDEKLMLNNLEITLGKMREVEQYTGDFIRSWVPGIQVLMDSARRSLNEVYEVNKELLANQQQDAPGPAPLTDAQVAGLEEKKKKAWIRAKGLVEMAFMNYSFWREDTDARKAEMTPVPDTPKPPKQ